MTTDRRALVQVLTRLEALPVLCEGMTFPADPWGNARAATVAVLRAPAPWAAAMAEALGAWEPLATPPDGLIVPVGPWNRARETAIEAIRHHLTASGRRSPPRADRVAGDRSDNPSMES